MANVFSYLDNPIMYVDILNATKKITEEQAEAIKYFLGTRNLSDCKSNDFAITPSVCECLPNPKETQETLFIVSFIPFDLLYLDANRYNDNSFWKDVCSWIEKNNYVQSIGGTVSIIPHKSNQFPIQPIHHKQFGEYSFETRNATTFLQPSNFSYSEFQSNGFWEKGIFFKKDKHPIISNIDNCLYYFISLVEYSIKYYKCIVYEGSVIVQISIKDNINKTYSTCFTPNTIQSQDKTNIYNDALKLLDIKKTIISSIYDEFIELLN